MGLQTGTKISLAGHGLLVGWAAFGAWLPSEPLPIPVQEVAVIGLADPLLGEAICACIVPVEGAIVTGHEIVGWCRETLAEDKVPDSVRFLDGLPRTDTGKVRRVDLSRLIQTESDPA